MPVGAVARILLSGADTIILDSLSIDNTVESGRTPQTSSLVDSCWLLAPRDNACSHAVDINLMAKLLYLTTKN